MRIAFFEIENWEKEYLAEKFSGHEVHFFSEQLSLQTAEQARGCEIVSVFIYSTANKAVLEKLPDAKLIATRSTGFDHIDVKAAAELGITVANVPTYGSNTVAEHAFALMLALAKKLYASVERTKQGDFSLVGLQAIDLKGKTLGIIGMGKIGREAADIAKGFEMKVLAYDPYVNAQLAEKVHFTYVPLEELLKSSDFITLHAALNDQTKHLINSSNVALIKKGAYLVNTARGGLVETEALVKALNEGILAGAGLDVLEEECFIKEERQLLSSKFPETCDIRTLLQNNMLLRQDNVLVTPHNAFNSREALTRILDTTAENITGFASGKPVNLVV